MTAKRALQELGDALDHAEATIPALHRLRSRYDGKDLILPKYPAVEAYRDLAVVLAAFDQTPIPHPTEINSYLRAARKDLTELQTYFRVRCEMRQQPGVVWPDGGRSVSLRTIIDIYADMRAARADVIRLEQAQKYHATIRATKLAVERDAKFRRRNPQAHAQYHAMERRR
jgi:hypothetical protein